jgi:hypothetical protein
VSEESHVEAMRAAIRGDFERLERRRGRQELMRVDEPPPAHEEGVVTVQDTGAPTRSLLQRLLSR